MNSLIKYWHFDFLLIAFMAVGCLGYLYLSGYNLKRQAWYFISALLIIIICMASPLHWLAENYLFSAHMVAHMMLFFIAAPLLVLSIPRNLPTGTKKFMIKFSRRLETMPGIALLLGISVMWFWHIPAVFNRVCMQGYLLHYTEMLSLISIGIIFSWPVIGYPAQYRIHPLKGVIYLFTACISCSLLGLWITFSRVGIYQHFLMVPGMENFSSVIQNKWGITPIIDQQMAGLIMWVPGCLIYLTGSIYLIKKWFTEKDFSQEEGNTKLTVK